MFIMIIIYFFLSISGLKGYFEEHYSEIDVSFRPRSTKYLTIIFTNEYQKFMYKEILIKIHKDINKNYVKIKFESNDDVPLNILVNICNLVLAIKCQRVYLNTCWYDQFYEGQETTYKMNKVRELKIDSPLWATAAKIINLLDFKPEKLSVETKSNTNNDIKVHQVRYENGGFYLTIDDIKGCFNFSNNLGILTMIFDKDDQKNKYHEIWKEILKIINKENRELELHEKIKITDSDLPIEHVFKIPSITIAIKSLIEKNNKFYLELSLNHCLYKINL